MFLAALAALHPPLVSGHCQLKISDEGAIPDTSWHNNEDNEDNKDNKNKGSDNKDNDNKDNDKEDSNNKDNDKDYCH